MNRVVPLYAIGDPATITIDGIEYRPAVTDAYGHLGIHVLSTVLPALAATSTKQDTMITALQLIDDLQAALESVNTNRLNVNVKATGASEVLAFRHASVDPSNTRLTAVTPTSGKAIRIISVIFVTTHTTAARFEAYFGTGAHIGINAGKEIAAATLDIDVAPNFGLSWPDGGGPVGAADEVVSLRTSTNITNAGWIVGHYREE